MSHITLTFEMHSSRYCLARRSRKPSQQAVTWFVFTYTLTNVELMCNVLSSHIHTCDHHDIGSNYVFACTILISFTNEKGSWNPSFENPQWDMSTLKNSGDSCPRYWPRERSLFIYVEEGLFKIKTCIIFCFFQENRV
jgi:hypothetical protein